MMNPCNEHEAQDVRESGAGFDCKVCEIERLTARNAKLEAVLEAAITLDDIGVDASGDDWDELAKSITAVQTTEHVRPGDLLK